MNDDPDHMTEADQQRVLSAALSHDLRQHARLIAVYASLMERDGLEPAQHERLQVIIDHAERLQGKLADLAEWMRLLDQPLQPLSTDLHALWAAVSADSTASITVGGSSAPLYLDAELIKRLLGILLANAERYHGPGRAVIHADLTVDDAAWQLTFIDDGPGIPMDERRRVLLPMVRLHTWEEQPGNGMGLAIAERIARLHAGTLTIGDAHGAGCVVVLRCPLRA